MNPESTSGRSILVVEDSQTQLAQLKHLLHVNGYAVLTALNGLEALEVIRCQVPDLIIADIIMPVMDGYELCCRIKEDEALKSIPVMLLTSLTSVGDVIRGLNAHADYYYTKPYEQAALLERVAAVLDQKRNQNGLVAGDEEVADALGIVLDGQKHTVSANRRQILSLLLSTYDHAVRRNKELMRAQGQLKTLNGQLQDQRSKLEIANTRLQALATVDSLTGLKNHRAFQVRLQEEFHRACRNDTPLSILMIDVDQFKLYNDAFGHPAGDEVLKDVATSLIQTLRLPDFSARYGGEEFVVILPDTDYVASLICGERIRETIEAVEWKYRPITVSVGAATLTKNMEAAAELMEWADRALYNSKRNGRNKVTHIEEVERDTPIKNSSAGLAPA
jgi:diguanylate cyclase (GGDEF)-like protein